MSAQETLAQSKVFLYKYAMDTTIVDRAVSAAGGQTALAKRLNIKPQAVQQWKRIPAGRVLEVERITGISRHELRDDLYPQEQNG